MEAAPAVKRMILKLFAEAEAVVRAIAEANTAEAAATGDTAAHQMLLKRILLEPILLKLILLLELLLKPLPLDLFSKLLQKPIPGVIDNCI